MAGSIDVAAPITENLLTLQLRGAEIANSPLQRTGTLRGRRSPSMPARSAPTTVCLVGTPLGDVSGYLGIIQRTVGELTAAGGTVKLTAGESVIMQRGSTIDVSGGWLNYEGGYGADDAGAVGRRPFTIWRKRRPIGSTMASIRGRRLSLRPSMGSSKPSRIRWRCSARTTNRAIYMGRRPEALP
ncbi:MAG: hypothetical protein WDN28_21910 [Chthoniobacter sp.]